MTKDKVDIIEGLMVKACIFILGVMAGYAWAMIAFGYSIGGGY